MIFLYAYGNAIFAKIMLYKNRDSLLMIFKKQLPSDRCPWRGGKLCPSKKSLF
jgi:hypothetical protein